VIVFILELGLVGLVVGIMNGALGIGGAIVMIPAMHQFVPGIDPHTAKGTSLFVIIFVAALNAWQQNRPWRDVPWKTVVVLGIGAMGGSAAGAWLTDALPGVAVTWLFIAALSLITVRLIVAKEPTPRSQAVGSRRHGLGLAIGTLTGFVGGMTGIGGGLILVPLALITGISTNARVTGLSNMVMVITGVAAVSVQIRAQQLCILPGTIGQINLIVAGALFVGALAGSPVGRWLNRHLAYRQRTRALVCLLIVVIARMAYQAFST